MTRQKLELKFINEAKQMTHTHTHTHTILIALRWYMWG